MWANDIHSRLNPTRIGEVLRPASVEELSGMIARILGQGRTFAVAGKRHAMGGQQFGTDADLIDITSLHKIISLDLQSGILEAEGGVTWPEIIDYCWSLENHFAKKWAITQKQTGADALSLGGALSSNVHGRGLSMRPIIQDVESFKLVTPAGEELECSRSANAELFKLAIGGYGLFGVIGSVKLRLTPRVRLRRTVREIDVEDLMPAFERRIRQDYLYGDFQYMTDSKSPGFLRKGVFSCYLPVDDSESSGHDGHRELSREDWQKLYRMAFTDKKGGYEAYLKYYLGTDGQHYWSDKHQQSTYLDDYHEMLGGDPKDATTLMISEIYVPRLHLARFMDDVREIALKDSFDIIYGTIRLIERDEESFLAWAKEDYACVIFNLRAVHTPACIEKTKQDFRALIDLALPYGGSYYLTYHRWARKEQVLACYPQFVDFLQKKTNHDPGQVIRSDWYAHYREMFAV